MAHPSSDLWGIPVKEIARICQVAERTARRWKDGTRRPPPSALILLRRDLGCFSPYWAGWKIEREMIIPPGAWAVRRDDALAVPLLHAHIAALRQQVATLKAELDAARAAGVDQPTAAQWVIRMK